MFSTALRKKRGVGLALLLVILILFFSFNRFPKLDAVGGDLDAVTSPDHQCFQGFCIEREPGSDFYSEWWRFSATYFRLVSVGMIFAFSVAGLAEAFLIPPRQGKDVLSKGVFRRTVQGAALGPVLNLCSACIVPVSSAFRKRGGGIDGAIAMVQGSATMNIPALTMVFFIFTPLLGISRLLLAIIGALFMGPIVLMISREDKGHAPDEQTFTLSRGLEEASSWRPAMTEAFQDWAKISLGYVVRLGPIMIVAGFISGLVIQWLSPETVSNYLGNDVLGVGAAATFGILINVPLLFEIPLVVLLLTLGMGTAPAATLLFTAAAGGPMTFWGLAKIMPKRAIAAFVTATWILGATGGLAVLAIGANIWDDNDLKIGTSTTSESFVNGRSAHSRNDPVASRSTVVPGQQTHFIDVTRKAGVDFHHNRADSFINIGGGTATGDYNGDGLLDIYVTNSAGSNSLYRNNGDGTFTDVALAAGVDDPGGVGNGAGWGDYDNDGDLDLFVANFGTSKLFQNSADGSFTDVTSQAGVSDPDLEHRSTGITWGDYDMDGYLDLLVVRWVYETDQSVLVTRDFKAAVRPLALYHNNGDETFTDVVSILGFPHHYPSNVNGAGFKPSFVDYDNDGDPDIYVVNDFGELNYPNVLWRNDGPNKSGGWLFTDVSASSGTDQSIFGMGLAVGDYDNDGDLDFYMTDMGDSEFLENQGDGTFTNVTSRTGTGRGKIPGDAPWPLAGNTRRSDLPMMNNFPDLSFQDVLNESLPDSSIGWGSVFSDFNNNGLLDLYYVAGPLDDDPSDYSQRQTNALFSNNGDGSFLDISSDSGVDDPGVGRGVASADFNNDGLSDLFVVNVGDLSGRPGIAKLFQNVSDTTNHWLRIKLVGTNSNRDAIGARIRITSGGVTQIREMGSSQSHMSHSVVPVHFGLGSNIKVDLVEIRWPSGGLQTLSNVPADQILTVTETPR